MHFLMRKGSFRSTFQMKYLHDGIYTFKNHHIVVFGLYVEAHNDPNITKNMAPRTRE